MPELAPSARGNGWPLLVAALVAGLLFCPFASAAPKKKFPSRPIDLNQATLGQLEELPGVGPATAKSILRFRKQSGPFERVDDLLAVRGISRRRLEKIRPYVFVGGRKSRRASGARTRANSQPRSGAHD